MHQSIETPTSHPRARVSDGGMDALLNTNVVQGGGVIDSYWTPTSTYSRCNEISLFYFNVISAIYENWNKYNVTAIL